MSVINNTPILYGENAGKNAMLASMLNIQSRYNDLKRNLLNQNYINARRQVTLVSLKKKIEQINSLYQQYNPSQVENLLLNSTSKNLPDSFGDNLESLASNSSSWLNKNYDALEANVHRGQFMKGLNDLYTLFNSQGVNIDNNSFNILFNQIYQSLALQGSHEGLKETGNILDQIGSISAAIKTNDVLNNLLDSFVQENKNIGISISETGTQKIPGTNQTRITDMVAVFYDNTTGELLTTLNFSNKFNAKYKPKAKSTGSAIKLATRTVSSFLNQSDFRYKDDYDIALSNFISYHSVDLEKDQHFERTDFIRDYKDKWNILRRTIGAEIVNNLLSPNNSSNDNQINDVIDIYVYGDKLFLDDTILSSKMQAKNKNFNLAQISLQKRNQLLRSAKLQSRPTDAVIQGREEYVYNKIIQPTIITYSQTISFI